MNLFASFCKRRKTGEFSAKDYEEQDSLEMAYIALWSVIEHTAKEVESERLCNILKKQIDGWQKYLCGEVKAPQPIKNFSTEARSIHSQKDIKDSLGKIPAISKLLQTKSKGKSCKYRDKRNAIAHHAEKFTSKTLFMDYKKTVLDAIVEMDEKLRERDNKK